MNVKEVNQHLQAGDLPLTSILAHYEEYQNRSIPLPFEFGLDELPREPGIISIRGPRQYGKSTWLEYELAYSIETFGPGSAYYINGDELLNREELLAMIESLVASFRKDAKYKRLFIDEVTAVDDWEIALKLAADRRLIKDVLVVTTGSNALDLRRGHEKLPGRKGRLQKTDYTFLPTSYRAFYTNVYREFRHDSLKQYLLTGGSPFAINESYHTESVPDFVRQVARDWVLGELVRTGRSRTTLMALMRQLYRFGGTPIGYAKLARECGLANNTVAAGYIEQLSDLMVALPSWQWDSAKDLALTRKPCKFPMINLSVALAFHPESPKNIWEWDQMSPDSQGLIMEWAVAQELWRRRVLNGNENPEELLFWQSDKHELDFVDENENLVEVKRGKASPLDFAWFPKNFPNRSLTVICNTPFETDWGQGVTLHQFLLRDPYFSAYVTDVPEDPDTYK